MMIFHQHYAGLFDAFILSHNTAREGDCSQKVMRYLVVSKIAMVV